MAKKKTPKKFRQARAEAKKEAKKVFSGKPQGYRRDTTVKYSADDVKALNKVSKEARGGFITDDRGQRVNVKPDETARERIAREKAEAMRKFREQAEAEEGPKKAEPKKKAAVKKTAAAAPAPAAKKKATKKAPVKKTAAKAPVKKAAVKPTKTFGEISKAVTGATKPATEKKMTRAERSAANKAKWASMTPAERKQWSASKAKTTEASAPKKPGVKKPSVVYSITDAKPGASDTTKPTKNVKKAKLTQKKAVATTTKAAPKTGTAVAVRPKGTVATTGAKATAKKAGAAGVAKTIGRGVGKVIGGRVGAALALGSLVASPIHKALSKDTKGRTTGDMMEARAKAAQAGGNKLTKDAYGRAVPGGKKVAVTGGGTTSKVATTRSNQPRNTGRGRFATSTAASQSKVTGGAKSGSYTVQRGDTLSGIAKNAGVSLAAIRAANPTIMKNPKYKQGSMIWAGTKVRIPKK